MLPRGTEDSTEIPDLPTDIETSSICSDSSSSNKGSETNASQQYSVSLKKTQRLKYGDISDLFLIKRLETQQTSYTSLLEIFIEPY